MNKEAPMALADTSCRPLFSGPRPPPNMTMTEPGNGRHYISFYLLQTDLLSLKTRERYVQLSEQKLEGKKKHCKPWQSVIIGSVN